MHIMVNLIRTISFCYAEFSYPEFFKLVDVSNNVSIRLNIYMALIYTKSRK